MFWGENKVEEIKQPEEYFYITTDGFIWYCPKGKDKKLDENRKRVGNYIEDREEAEKRIYYLRAKAIIKQDAKGFKPDWQNADEERYCGKWDFDDEIPHISILNIFKAPQIYFKSKKDIQESFKKHPDEWKTYLTYEQ